LRARWYRQGRPRWYSTDDGATWLPVANYVLSGVNWSGTGPTYASVQTGTIAVRDHASQTLQSLAASFNVVLPGNSSTGALVLADGSGVDGIGAGLTTGTVGTPALLAVNFGTTAGSVADGGALASAAGSIATAAAAAATALAAANSALPTAGGTMTGPMAFASGAGTITSGTNLYAAPTDQLWLGAAAGTGAVYSATIAGVTSNPGTTAADKIWNNGGMLALAGAANPAPTMAPTFTAAQPYADVAGSAGIFSHNGGIVPTPPAVLTGLRVGDKWKLGVFNAGEVLQPSALADAWPTLQNFLLYAQLHRLAQAGVSLDNIAERKFVDVLLPAGNYYVSQPLVVPDGVRFGGPGRILPTPYVGAQTGTTVSGVFDGTVSAQANYTPVVAVAPRGHLSDLNICVAYDGGYQHKSSGVCIGKNWQPTAGAPLTIGNPGTGYAVGNQVKLAQPSAAPFSACVATVTAIAGSGSTGPVATAVISAIRGDFALPAVTYNGGPNLQQQQWTAANGFNVFDPAHPGCFLTSNYGAGAGTGATLGIPASSWTADFIAGGNQYLGGAALTNGSQAGRIQVTGAVPNNYDVGGMYGPTFNVMLTGLEFEIDSIQGLGGRAGLWAIGAQDARIGRLNFVDAATFAWFRYAGSIECPNCVADTCGQVVVIDQSHGIVLKGRAFFEEGNIVNPLPACNVGVTGAGSGPVQGAFAIGAGSTLAAPVIGCNLEFILFNMGGLPASTIAAKGLTGVSASTQPAICTISNAVANRIDLAVSNNSQYGASGGSPFPNPSLQPTSGIYQLGANVDSGNDLRGSIDTVPTIDSVAPPAQMVTLTTGHGFPGCAIRVWDGLHQCRIGPFNTVEMFGTAAPSNGISGTGAGLAAPGSTYVVTTGGSGRRYVNTGTQASPIWS
jgi:hypothetical protein